MINDLQLPQGNMKGVVKAAYEKFPDVIASSPTHKSERQLAPHPSLKPQLDKGGDSLCA